MLFVKKTNNSLRFCVDYQNLNEITIKNNYSLLLFLKILKRFAYAKRFIKINIYNVYYKIRVRKKDEWKIVFRTRYDQFEYQIMSFDLANASTIFQNYVNKTLKSYIDIFYVIYLNDILIYSKSKKLHWKHMRQILRALLKHRLYIKLSKCAFNRDEITFLRFIINQYNIQMKQTRIEIIIK